MKIYTLLVLVILCSNMKAISQSIPIRSRQANKDQVDLTSYYTSSLSATTKTGIDLSSLPHGMQILAQSAFDIRGIIQLAGKSESAVKYPKQVKDIKINNTSTCLHFLHGTSGSVEEGTGIGEYVLHFANGKIIKIPIIYQQNVRDCFIRDGEQIPTNAEIAWAGQNDASRKTGSNIQVYNYTVNNPFPDLEIATVDFISVNTKCAPFLIALSMEKNGKGYRKHFRNVRIDNSIIPRSAAAGSELIDLSRFYNTSTDDDWINYPGHDFQDLPKGIQTFSGVKFDVRGMVALASGSSLSSSRVLFPETITGITVHRKGKNIYFLQGCGYSDVPGTKLGEYIIHYINGETRVAPIVYKKNVLDWWCKPDDGPPTDAVEAWRGQNPSSRSAGSLTRLIKYTWENPLPDLEISSIDFVTHFAKAVPFLIAITIE